MFRYEAGVAFWAAGDAAVIDHYQYADSREMDQDSLKECWLTERWRLASFNAGSSVETVGLMLELVVEWRDSPSLR